MSAGFFRYYLGRAGIKITQKSYGEKNFLLQYNALSYSHFWLPYSFERIPPTPPPLTETNLVISGPEVLGSKPFRPRVDS